MPSEKLGSQGTPEEIKKAKESMTGDQADLSELREIEYSKLSEEDRELLAKLELTYTGGDYWGRIYGRAEGKTIDISKKPGGLDAKGTLDGKKLSEREVRDLFVKYGKFSRLQSSEEYALSEDQEDLRKLRFNRRWEEFIAQGWEKAEVINNLHESLLFLIKREKQNGGFTRPVSNERGCEYRLFFDGFDSKEVVYIADPRPLGDILFEKVYGKGVRDEDFAQDAALIGVGVEELEQIIYENLPFRYLTGTAIRVYPGVYLHRRETSEDGWQSETFTILSLTSGKVDMKKYTIAKKYNGPWGWWYRSPHMDQHTLDLVEGFLPPAKEWRGGTR